MFVNPPASFPTPNRGKFNLWIPDVTGHKSQHVMSVTYHLFFARSTWKRLARRTTSEERVEAVHVVATDAPPPRGGNIPRHKLQERFNAFGLGQWASLIQQAIKSTEIVAVARRRGQHQRGDDVGKRAERSQSFVLVGELSLGRQALEGEAVAPDRGNVEFVGGS